MLHGHELEAIRALPLVAQDDAGAVFADGRVRPRASGKAALDVDGAGSARDAIPDCLCTFASGCATARLSASCGDACGRRVPPGAVRPPPCDGDDRLIGTSVGVEAAVRCARASCNGEAMETARGAFIPAPFARQMPHGISMPAEVASDGCAEEGGACGGDAGGAEVPSPSTPIKRDHPILLDDHFLLFASSAISEFCTELRRRVPRAEVLPSTTRAGTVLLAAFRLQDPARAAAVASSCEDARVFALAAFSVAAKFLGCRPTTPMAALTALVAKVDAKALSAAELELCCTLEWNVSRVFREAACF